ncbi:unnamed protein product, partial [Sphenostylis stenocarpa]
MGVHTLQPRDRLPHRRSIPRFHVGAWATRTVSRHYHPDGGIIPIRSHTMDRTGLMGVHTHPSPTQRIVTTGRWGFIPINRRIGYVGSSIAEGSATSGVVFREVHKHNISPRGSPATRRDVRRVAGQEGQLLYLPVYTVGTTSQRSSSRVKGAAVDPKSCRPPNKVESVLFED